MDTLKIIQHNVAHWHPNRHNFTNTYNEINADIILINSHGIGNNKTIHIHNYTTHTINSSGELHDGSAILVKSNIKHKITNEFDTDILQVTIETTAGPINIATTYLPPRRPYLPITDFHRLASNNTPTYILGDLNAKHPCLGTHSTNTVGKGLEMLINRNKLTHLGPNFPTYISHNTQTTPDIILANSQTYHNYTVKQGPTSASDHLPIIFTITTQPIRIPSPPRPHYKAADWDSFQTYIDQQMKPTSNNNLSKIEIDTHIRHWYDTILNAIKLYIPMKHQKTIQHPITNPIIKNIQYTIKQLLHRANIIGWEREKYKYYSTLKTNLVLECKAQNNRNWENTIDQLRNLYKDPKQFWSKIKRLKENKINTSPYINHNNQKIYDIKEKETIFRNIWENIFTITPEENILFDQETDNNINNYITANRDLISPYHTSDLSRLNNQEYTTATITLQEITNTIKSFKNNTPGHSKINKTILTNLPESALTKLTEIFNHTYSAGYFPQAFKTALIKLIPKPNKATTDPYNYRPISLLEVPGKILEKIINKRLRTYLEHNNILPPAQHGFRANKSTDTALAVTTEKIANALGNKQQCCIVLRDVSKAFDKVWHEGLKYKIHNSNIPIVLSKILCNFLDNRHACINLQTYQGPTFQIKSGVPQGSSISPTLYSLYTHDIPSPSHGCANIIYADDITQIITQPGRSRKMLAKKIEREITKINEFENKWKIKTNTSKFTVIPLTINKTHPITINGTNIPYSNKGKILGMHINTRGINIHIKHIKNTAKTTLSTIRRFQGLSTNIKTHLIKACVLPVITYPPYPLNAISRSATISLQTLQNQALRFASAERYPYTKTTEELHQISNTSPINITLHNRGNKIKEKLVNNLQDELYRSLTSEENHSEHSWFRKPYLQLSKDQPPPLYTSTT